MTTATGTHDAGIDAPSAEYCAGCGAPNDCAVVRGAAIEACWCWQQPRAGLKPMSSAGPGNAGAELSVDTRYSGVSKPSATENTRCYCATCLSQRVAQARSSHEPASDDNQELLP